MTFRLRALGGLDIRDAPGAAIVLPMRTAQALLAYLDAYRAMAMPYWITRAEGELEKLA